MREGKQPETIFPQRMKEYRKVAMLTQQDIADKLGVKLAAYGHYENGKRQPGYSFLRDFSKLSGWSPSYLLGLSDIRQPDTIMGKAIRQYDSTNKHVIGILYEVIAELAGGE